MAKLHSKTDVQLEKYVQLKSVSRLKMQLLSKGVILPIFFPQT
jgi:hypothetical protein